MADKLGVFRDAYYESMRRNYSPSRKTEEENLVDQLIKQLERERELYELYGDWIVAKKLAAGEPIEKQKKKGFLEAINDPFLISPESTEGKPGIWDTIRNTMMGAAASFNIPFFQTLKYPVKAAKSMAGYSPGGRLGMPSYSFPEVDNVAFGLVENWLENQIKTNEQALALMEQQMQQGNFLQKFLYHGGKPIPTVALTAMTGGALGSAAAAKMAGAAGTLSTAGMAVPAGYKAVADATPLAQALTTKLVSMAPFGAHAFGGYAREAEQEGADVITQLAYGMHGALMEIMTEAPIFSRWAETIGKYGGDLLIKRGTESLLKKWGAAGVRMLADAMAEAWQEVIVGPLAGMGKKALVNKDMPWLGEGGVIDFSQMPQDAFGGFAMSVLLTAAGLPVSAISRRMATKALNDIEKGRPVTAGDIAEISKQLTEDLQKYEEQIKKELEKEPAPPVTPTDEPASVAKSEEKPEEGVTAYEDEKVAEKGPQEAEGEEPGQVESSAEEVQLPPTKPGEPVKAEKLKPGDTVFYKGSPKEFLGIENGKAKLRAEGESGPYVYYVNVRDFERHYYTGPVDEAITSDEGIHPTEKEPTYYRFTKRNKPLSDWGHAMFATDRTKVEGYGPHGWTFDDSKAVYVGDLKEDIINAWNEDREKGFSGYFGSGLTKQAEEYWKEIEGEEIYEQFNPKDIVNSAEAWDSDLVQWIWERILEPRGIMAVTTRDGAVVFDENQIKPLKGEEVRQGEEVQQGEEEQEAQRDEEVQQGEEETEPPSDRERLINKYAEMLKNRKLAGLQKAFQTDDYFKQMTPEQHKEILERAEREDYSVVPRRLSEAIDKKDVGRLLSILSVPENVASKQMFKEITGIDPGKTVKSAAEAVRKFVGEKAYNKHLAEEKAEKKAREEARKKEQMEKALSQTVSYRDADGIPRSGTIKEMIDKFIEQGFTEIREGKRGAIHVLKLVKDGRYSITFTKKAEKDYIRQRIKELKEGEKGAVTEQLGPDGEEPLDDTSSEDVPRAEEEGDTVSDASESAGDDGRDVSRPGDEGDVSGPGEGDRTTAVDTAPDGGGRSDSERGAVSGESALNKRNVRIKTLEVEGGAKTRVRNNIEAIRIIKQLEAEGREATAEEQEKLLKYVGWGDSRFQKIFDSLGGEWEQERQELKEILTPEEYNRLRGSVLNAHYTSQEVIEAMYQAVQRLGFRGGYMLEPALGVGHFIGLLPDGVVGKTRVTGVELDTITGKIAKALYPDADIRVQGFESANLPDNFYDLVISNVPFGNYPVVDMRYEKTGMTSAIHNYFFAKSLDVVRPGGVIAFITSRYTMDAGRDRARQYIARRADLLGAIRLPNTAFKKNAGTEVVTDIIFLRKKKPGEKVAGEAWMDLEMVGENIYVNEYYAKHPEMVLGKHSLTGSMYGKNEYTVEPDGRDLRDALAEAIQNLPESIIKKPVHQATEAAKPDKMIPPSDDVKENAFTVKDGKIMQNVSGKLVTVNAGDAVGRRIKGLVMVRDATREYFRAQLQDAPDNRIAFLRQRLNQVYDAFVKKNGPIHSKANIKAFIDDPDLPLLLSLERWDEDTKTATKADCFTQRTIRKYERPTSAKDAKEALIIALNETGTVDIERMCELTGMNEEALVNDLAGLVYPDPEGGYKTADEYLSGNVRRKLETAKRAAEVDPRFEANVEALEKVIPPDIEPKDIKVRLGVPWIGPEDIKSFICELLNANPTQVRPIYIPELGEWKLDIDSVVASSGESTYEWGTTKINAVELIEQALNSRKPTITEPIDDKRRRVDVKSTMAARAKQEKIQARFAEWVWEDRARAKRLSRVYNDVYNAVRLREYDGSHLTFPGMNPAIKLRPHQVNAVWRVISGGNTLLAHTVGAGKTYEMVASAMELKRMGVLKKPMFVVPNHLVEQFGAEALTLYPSAKIFVAGRDHFQKAKRKQAMAKIATGDWDMVVVAHSSFEKLSMPVEEVEAFYMEQLDALDEAIRAEHSSGARASLTEKQLQMAKKRLEAKMEKTLAHLKERQDTDFLTFDQLGVDGLFIDEAHRFKNLFFVSRMNNVSGLGSKEGVQKTFDLFMKIRYLRRLNGGRGIVFATGTPISNSMAELYTLQRYLDPDTLEEYGFANFDLWANQCGEVITVYQREIAGGKYRPEQKFAKFINLPEVITMFRKFADIKTADDLNLPRPEIEGGKAEAVICPPSQALKDFIPVLVERMEEIKKKGRPEKGEDNILKVNTDARKAALDMRLIDPNMPDDPNSKVNICVEKVFDIWKATKKDRMTQVIFCDIGTPSEKRTDSFNLYDDFKKKLVKKGVPANEIAFIHDAKKDEAKLKLFTAMNEGKVRILLGSTEKLGVGSNFQRRLCALHHLDVPYRPPDLEQREGRILRQGNINEKVKIFNYIAEGSFDARMWGIVSYKAKFINQLLSGKVTGREADDAFEAVVLQADEMAALASGNPLAIREIELSAEIAQLEAEKADFLEQRRRATGNVARLPGVIQAREREAENIKKDIERRQDVSGDKFRMTIGKSTYTSRGKAQEALQKAIEFAHKAGKRFKVGSVGGLDLFYDPSSGFYLAGALEYVVVGKHNEEELTPRKIENVLKSLERRLAGVQEEIEYSEKVLKASEEQLKKAFPKEEKLQELIIERDQIRKELNLSEEQDELVTESGDDVSAEFEAYEGEEGTAKDEEIASKYYIYATDGKFREVEGEPLDITALSQFDLFVRRTENNKWVVSEGATGYALATGSTKEEAIANAKEFFLTHGVSKVSEHIEARAKEHGFTPRYTARKKLASRKDGDILKKTVEDLNQEHSMKRSVEEKFGAVSVFDFVDRLKAAVEAFLGHKDTRVSSARVEKVLQASLAPRNAKEQMRRAFLETTMAIRDIFDYEWTVKNFPKLQDDLRRLQGVAADAMAWALEAYRAVTGFLNTPAEFEIFRKLVFLRDFRAGLESGDPTTVGGLTLEEIQQAENELWVKAGESKTAIQSALDAHDKIFEAAWQELIRRGKVDPSAEHRTHYVPHRVLDYMQDVDRRMPAVARRFKTPYRYYLQKRSGLSEKLIDTDYASVTIKHLTKFYIDNAMDDFALEIAQKYDLREKLEKEDLREVLGLDEDERIEVTPGKLYEHNGQLYRGWQYDPGRQIYSGLAVGENAVMDAILLLQAQAEEAGIEDEVLKDAFMELLGTVKKAPMIGRYKKTYLLPVDVADRLTRLREPSLNSHILSWIVRAVNLWKGVVLGPTGAGIPFQVANFLGDAINLYREDPVALLSLGEAWRIVGDWQKGRTADLSENDKKLIKIAEEMRVVESGIMKKGGLPYDETMKRLEPQKYLLRRLNGLRWYQDLSERRELSVRFAKLIKDVERIEKGQMPVARSLDVKKLEKAGFTKEEIAGKIAREFAVDYGKLTPEGKSVLRDLLFPFMTFYVQNAQNWFKYIKLNPGNFVLKFLLPAGMMALWNWLRFPDEEEELPVWYRVMPHIITGYQTPDGKPIIIAFETPMDQALTMVGLDITADLARQVMRGDKSIDEAAAELAKNVLTAVPREAWGLFNPFFKAPIEAAMNKNTFTGRPIVPERLKGTAEEKKLKAKYVIQQWYTPYAQYTRSRQRMAEGGFPAPFDLKRAVGIREVNLQSETINRFYDRLEALEAEHREWKAKRKPGEPEPLRFQVELKELRKTRNILNDLWKKIRDLEGRDMPDEQRKRLIEQYRLTIERHIKTAEKRMKRVRGGR